MNTLYQPYPSTTKERMWKRVTFWAALTCLDSRDIRDFSSSFLVHGLFLGLNLYTYTINIQYNNKKVAKHLEQV